MASNLDYLDPALIPLEDKVKAYLEAEEDLRKAIVESKSLPNSAASEAQANQAFDHRPATGSFDQHTDEVEQRIQNLQDDLQLLRQEIIGMLPSRNEFVKVNLGYGPSRVGAFTVDHGDAASAAEPRYELRIVH
ncbi:hypothetical protein [Hymenobacter cellulosivorans]|uniref:TraR/DksA family transcriptional regulator n=1 Tax=Hymenobacter cellulosivorans TaxID=2932249 RepID=A0ABY4F4C9_9BACT|nr:hypothetical protein [Hymenobacter cellulosivorans]UOQ51155.1 hypothetical protein MUN80_15445 [Hymenobacter cellulosivorans]